MNETARLLPPTVTTLDHNRPSGSPIEQKPNVWSNGTQMMNLSPPAGDQAAMLGVNSEPLPSSASMRDNEGSWSPGLDKSGDDISGDPEGVWSPDIEQAFQEALAIYPPCGRRKIILSDEGKMYGRNELIARYIKIRCGKTRTRKQVSSHIQVLARKRQRDGGPKMKGETSSPSPTASVNNSVSAPSNPNQSITQTQKDLQSLTQLSQLSKAAPLLPAGIYPAFFPSPFNASPGFSQDIKDYQKTLAGTDHLYPFPLMSTVPKCITPPSVPQPPQPNNDGSTVPVASSLLTLQGFSAYVEPANGQRKEIMSIRPTIEAPLEEISLSFLARFFPERLNDLLQVGPPDAFFLIKCWANVDFDANPDDSLYAVDSFYSSQQPFTIKVSTQACSFGRGVVEKIETFAPFLVDGRYVYQLTKSAMCEYMVTFITELKKLDCKMAMNNVLENFTVLQVVSNEATGETLMVLALMFDVSSEINSEVFRFIP